MMLVAVENKAFSFWGMIVYDVALKNHMTGSEEPSESYYLPISFKNLLHRECSLDTLLRAISIPDLFL